MDDDIIREKDIEVSFAAELGTIIDCGYELDFSIPSLATIPIEIFLEICSYLSPGFVSGTLSAVCRRFHDILSDDTLWRCWVKKMLSSCKYPPMDRKPEDISWEKECVNISRLNYLWKNEKKKTKHVVMKNVHSSSVDSIVLLKGGKLCISGGRDRALALWDVKEVTNSYKNSIDGTSDTPVSSRPLGVVINSSAHDGWIWDLASHSNATDTVLSASWDSLIKVWDVETNLTCKEVFRCSLSVLCLTCVDENVTVAGLFSPNVVVVDRRAGRNPVSSYVVHKASVLAITLAKPGSNMLYTASEDHTIASIDLRVGAVEQKRSISSKNSRVYALSLAANNDYYPNALFAGGTDGNIYMFNTDTFTKLSSVSLRRTDLPEGLRDKLGNKITGLALGQGSLLSCSESGIVNVMNPSLPPNRVSTLKSTTTNITGLSYENDILAIGTCDSAVELWVPLDSPVLQ